MEETNTRTICALGEEDASKFLLFSIQPHCKKHRHLTKEEAIREIRKQRCIYIGAKQVYQTSDDRIVLAVRPNYQSVSAISQEEAKELVSAGHATWREGYPVIDIKRNLKGRALSLKIGHTLAEALARGELFAKIACQEIVNHKPVR